MRNILLFIIGTALLTGCASMKPTGFTYTFEDRYTGLDTLINIDGYYITKKQLVGNNFFFMYMYMFYSNGIFFKTNVSEITPEVIESFTGKYTDYRFINWGTYRINGDTIHAECIFTDGWLPRPEAIKIDYIILPDPDSPKENTTGVILKDDSLQYMAIGKFHPLETKRDYRDCPWLKRKWFHKKK